MSLFPAYSIGNPVSSSSKDDATDKTEWLSNSSFAGVSVQQTLVIDISSSSSEDEEKPSVHVIDISSDSDDRYKKKKKKKKKRRKLRHEDEKPNYDIDVKNLYFEDKLRDRINFQIDTFHSRARPAYHASNNCLGFVLVNKSRPLKSDLVRYFCSIVDVPETNKRKRNKLLKTKRETQPEPGHGVSQLEQEHKNKVQSLNQRLNQRPDDEPSWIEYINLQDQICQLTRYKTEADKERAKLQKQLSLVDKALEKIPSSTTLFEMKLQFMSSLLAADDFATQLECLLKKDSANLALWQALITTMKFSVALCNVNKINQLISRRFNIFRHKFKVCSNEHDIHLLGMLFESLMFLRHTGHWEHMWQAMKYNLTLNLNLAQDNLIFSGSIEEKKLIDMEEVILTSGLPLNQLWLRIESLRERCHWISIEQNQLDVVGDPKRFISSEDVTDFVHPFSSNESNFHFAVHCLVLLKVPLLPTGHCLLKNLQLDRPCWTADSAECILPLIYPVFEHTTDLDLEVTVFEGILQNYLTSGPQFLSFHPAQESYLEFIRMVFRNLADILPSEQKDSIYIWWLRFERLLIIIDKKDSPNTKGKKMKTMIKDFLKKPENRNNLHFYREYAMTELEFGRVDSCINILKSAVQSFDCHSLRLADSNKNTAIFSVHKKLCELYLRFQDDSRYAEQILNVVTSLAVVPDDEVTAVQGKLLCIEKYFERCVQRFLSKESDDSDGISFLPNTDCDIISCYAYIMYIQQREQEQILNMIDKCLQHASGNPSLQEQLYECKISLLQLFCKKDPKNCDTLKNTVLEALTVYANNFYIISVWARIQGESPYWQRNCTSKSNALWQFLALCLIYQRQIKKLKSLQLFEAVDAMRNKTLSLYRTLTNDKYFRNCPLVWRLYMSFLREENLCAKIGEKVYHVSLNNCPWARCLYIDSAEVAPQKLIQIQDMLREKDLRMHITPAELDILRG